jgi:rfaE bifunctional protein nucleotidyltransferase chain/domain
MLVSLKKFLEIRRECAESGKVVVFTNGCFDILHRGHLDYLSKAKKLGDILVVAVNTDLSVKMFKSARRPIIPEKERAELVAGLKPVDYVVLFEEETPERIIKAIKPDILAKGADYTVNEIVGADFVKSYGGKVRRIRLVPGLSTTAIIKKIKKLKGPID